MFIDKWILVVAAIVVVLLARTIFRLTKQVRCLRYCYINLSAWTHTYLAEIRDYDVSAFGEENTSYDVLDFEKIWGEKVDRHIQAMRRAGLPPPDLDDKGYPLADA